MSDDEQDWIAAFASANRELPGERFTTQVVRRVRRRLWIRGAVLGAACVLGAVSALGPLHQMWDSVSMGLSTITVQWRDVTWYMQYGLPSLFLSVAFAWPILARWLAR
ncbi:MAG: hypothetical protein ABI640_03920 [Gammaproteobacteria bacterium]